jgi:endonuclease/exonuclease/phosphatase family metal-dependent hydrolase
MYVLLPPSDSPYHNFMPLADISSRIQTTPDEGYLVISDLNARFGDFIKDKVMPKPAQYLTPSDSAATANANARWIVGSLQPLVLVNNLKYGDQEFPSALTYRQGTRWVSELDHCLVSPVIVEQIKSFLVHQEPKLPSDHAPISHDRHRVDQNGQRTAARAAAISYWKSGHTDIIRSTEASDQDV